MPHEKSNITFDAIASATLEVERIFREIVERLMIWRENVIKDLWRDIWKAFWMNAESFERVQKDISKSYNLIP